MRSNMRSKMIEFRYVYNIPLEIRHLNPSENFPIE